MRLIIISVPPPSVLDSVEPLRQSLNKLAGSREALRYPLHLTLRTGLVFPDYLFSDVVEEFFAHAASLRPVSIRSDGLLSTLDGNSPFLGWKVALTPELLDFHQHLLAFSPWRKGPQGTWRPHISLSYGDLSETGRSKILNTIGTGGEKLPPLAWLLDSVALYRETGPGWIEAARLNLNKS